MCEFHEDIKFNTFSQNHDEKDTFDYKIAYENQLTLFENKLILIEKLKISADAENTVKMFDKLNDELEEKMKINEKEMKRKEMNHEEEMKIKEMNHKEETKRDDIYQCKERIALFDELVAKNYEDMSFIEFGWWFLEKIYSPNGDCVLKDESPRISEEYHFMITRREDFARPWDDNKLEFMKFKGHNGDEEYDNASHGVKGFWDWDDDFIEWFIENKILENEPSMRKKEDLWIVDPDDNEIIMFYNF